MESDIHKLKNEKTAKTVKKDGGKWHRRSATSSEVSPKKFFGIDVEHSRGNVGCWESSVWESYDYENRL